LLYCVEFSGESYSAVQSELRSLKDSYPGIRILWINARGAVIEGSLPVLKEMAFARRISEVIVSGESIEDFEHIVLPAGKFYLRRVRLVEPRKDYSESELADKIGSKGRVSFSNPDFVALAIFADRWYISIVKHTRENKAMELRRAPMRPFFSPISLHPKYARFMVNLSRTHAGDTILDPFCGTGGILIEAGLSGRRVIGNDASLVMVKGARLNLKYYSIDCRIYNSDTRNLKINEHVDAIVSDLPYGRNSPLLGDIKSLYESAFKKFSDILDRGRYCIVIVGNEGLLSFANDFSTVDIIRMKVHNSLTRSFVVLRKN